MATSSDADNADAAVGYGDDGSGVSGTSESGASDGKTD